MSTDGDRTITIKAPSPRVRATRLSLGNPSGHECGASSSEFAFAILVLAVAVVVGGLGGVWIAKRESVQKPKPVEPPPAAEQALDKPAGPPEGEKAPQAPSAPQAASKESTLKLPEIKPQPSATAPKPAASQLPSTEAIRYSSRGGTTEVTIELGAASLVRAAGLSNPERVYFDFQAGGQTARPGGRIDAKSAIDISNDALLAGIRVARWKSGDTRVVLDLKRPCGFSYHLSSQPASSLIVELKAH